MKKIKLELGGQFKHNNIGAKKFNELLERVFARPEDQMMLVFGAPGIGKTTIVYDFIRSKFGNVIDQGEFKREGGINLVVLRTEDMDRSSFSLPGYDRPDDQPNRRALQCPFGYIPAYKPVGDMPDPEDPDYEQKCKDSIDWNADQDLGRGIIFLDEINRCNPDAEDVIKNIIERKFCDGWHIGSGWGIVAAGNRMEDDPDSVHEIGTAFFNRFGLQFNYVPRYDEWREWASHKAYMNELVMDWVKDNPEHFYYNTTCDTDANPGAEDKKFTTPRTWELVCKNMSVAYMLKTGRYSKTKRLPAFDITEFSEAELRNEMSSLDPETVTEFVKFIKMIQTVDVNRVKNEVWKLGKKAAKIQNRDGSSPVIAVENAIIKMCIDARTNGMPEDRTEVKRNLLKWTPTIEEVNSFFTYLTQYSMSTAQMAVQYYFATFDVFFKEVFRPFIRMWEYKTIAEKGGRDSDKAVKMYENLKSKLQEDGVYDYCYEFNKCANIIQTKWHNLLENVAWDK